MKRIILLCLAFLLLMPACFANVETKTNLQLANGFYTALIGKDFQSAFSMMNAEMKDALESEKELQTIWEQLENKAGKYEKHLKAKEINVDENTYCYFFPTQFENTNLTIQITIVNSEIAGFFINP